MNCYRKIIGSLDFRMTGNACWRKAPIRAKRCFNYSRHGLGCPPTGLLKKINNIREGITVRRLRGVGQWTSLKNHKAPIEPQISNLFFPHKTNVSYWKKHVILQRLLL